MIINYTLLAFAVLVQFVFGALWYSPLMFGKWWMQIMGGMNCSDEEKKKMQKEMAPFYGLQLLLTVIFTYVLAVFIYYLNGSSVALTSYGVALAIWFGFILPTQISGVIWANTKRIFWTKQILIMAGYQLVSIMLATYILSM